MINQLLLNMLVRQVKNKTISVEDIKEEKYKNAVKEELDVAQ